MGTSDKVATGEARELAWRTLQLFLIAGEAGQTALSDWSVDNLPEAGGNVFQGNGLEIYDVRGRRLFHGFSCALQNGKELRALAAADRRLGAPVFHIGIGDGLRLEEWTAAAEKKAAQERLTVVAGRRRLVCYSYPKLGLLCEDKDGRGFVVDIADRSVVPVRSSTSLPDAEGPATWSPLDAATLAGAKQEARRWRAAKSYLEKVPLARRAGPFRKASLSQKVLELKLHGQQTPVYCAVASAQMVLEFHDILKSQDDIAAAMQTGPAGSSNENQVTAYASLSANKYKGVLEQPATFAVARQEIEQNCPLKSGIPAHARAAAGWKTERAGEGEAQFLYIYDPWPPNQGTVYWEDWAAVKRHTNFIKVHPAGSRASSKAALRPRHPAERRADGKKRPR